MELWTIVLAIWITTWLMIFGRTYPLVKYMISNTIGGEVIVRFKYSHMVIYAITLFIITPPCWKIAFSEEYKRKWCVAYVREVCRSKT